MRQALYSIFRYFRSRALPFLLLALVVFLCLWTYRGTSTPAQPPLVAPGQGVAGEGAAAVAAAGGPGGVSGEGATIEVDRSVPELLARNQAPGRIVFLLVEMKGAQLRLTGGVGASGDFELGPAKHPRPGHLLVEFHDEAGKVVGSTVVDDPQQRFMEWPDETEPGRLRSRIVEQDEGQVSLRLPGNLYPASLTLYRPAGSGLQVLANASLR